MNERDWQKTLTLELNGKLISRAHQDGDPDRVSELEHAQVAFDGAFLHIAPEPSSADDDPPVTVVPATALKRLTYEQQPPKTGVAPWVSRR
ncbi:hypothetical protein ABCR94_13390 [Streptomyces sp. 21So2-11]|uniref:hypothetical protein n=1 Tax=Streptomyces sp. 21So2-11 TaxID=3144408 RepID=UPI00321A784E